MKKISVVSLFLCIAFAIASFIHVGIWLYFVFFSTEGNATLLDTASTNISFIFTLSGFESEINQINNSGLNPEFWLTIHRLLYQLAIYGILFLLFNQYRKGDIFSFASVIHLRRLGLCVLFWSVVEIMYPSALILTLKQIGRLEHCEISFGIDASNVETLATGFIILVIGSIMAEAARLKDEQELVI